MVPRAKSLIVFTLPRRVTPRHADVLPVGIFLLGLASLAISSGAEPVPKYAAQFADGTRVTGNKLSQWNSPQANVRLENHRLNDPQKPLRWLLDTTLPPADSQGPFLEFAGGDRLPGLVLEFRSGSQLEQCGQDVLAVRPSVDYSWPGDRQRNYVVRVLVEELRRIVWKKTGVPYRPGSLFLRDGRQLTFRALRWSRDGVRLLRSEGIETFFFDQIAELHLPEQDTWSAYVRQLARMDSACSEPLVRLDCTTGLQATASQRCWQPDFHGDRNRPRGWLQRIQPAWAFDPLWVPFESIRLWEFRPIHEISLSRLEPVNAQTRHALAGGWAWKPGRNVQGGPLRSGGRAFAAGFGVQAYCRLEFQLPPTAEALRTKVGLDALVGSGGCARGRVFVMEGSGPAARDRELASTEPLIGSTALVDLGRLPLPSPSPAGRSGNAPRAHLVLEADPLFTNHPAGADPLDIRDSLNWLDPVVELNPRAVRDAVRAWAPKLVGPWKGWTINGEDPSPVELVRRWDEKTESGRRSYRLEVLPRVPVLSLARPLSVTEETRWLAVAVSRTEKDAPSFLELWVNDKRVDKQTVPFWEPNRLQPQVEFSLGGFVGQTVTLELRIPPAGPQGWLHWRRISLASDPEGLRRLFEDEENLVKLLQDGDGKATPAFQQPYSGKLCLKVTAGEAAVARQPTWSFPIRKNPGVGEYRWLRFAWRKQGGQRVALRIAHQGQLGPPQGKRHRSFCYDAGVGPPSYQAARRLSGRAPGDWLEQTVDLYAHFGEFELTGLGFSIGRHPKDKPLDPRRRERMAQLLPPPGPEAAWFDHIYLARSPEDLRKIETKPVGD